MKHSPPPLRVAHLPPEWERMPMRLILNLEIPLKEFLADLEHTEQYEYEPEDFLNEILLYVKASFIDIESLDELLEATGHYFPVDRATLVPALARLGKSLLNELHLCRVYASDGLLHYRVDGWLDAYTPVFVRSIELAGTPRTTPRTAG